MSDRFRPLTMEQLAAWIFDELEGKGSALGIPEGLFFTPAATDGFVTSFCGHRLETPFGVAAGPHSQLAGNIVAAWLCGARLIELKTVQTLDEIDVCKPCIDMLDEGFNVEWSQELRVDESFDEYLKAWVLIHVLHRRLGFPGESPGVVFNVSVGYDLAGIQNGNMQRFLAHVEDCGELLGRHLEVVARRWSEAGDLDVPQRISDNVTLSTMHGCPPEEQGRIAAYLMEEHGLHTSVKLNPTLLGPERVRAILNQNLGYRDVVVPDDAFEHDVGWDAAVELITELRAVADRLGLHFGVKLSNTLEVENNRSVFAAGETAMYMSGRPLHALTVNLAARLAETFDGELPMSFAGGADVWNVGRLLACGLGTITSCSDLLRPGGYSRLLQYVEAAGESLEAAGAEDIPGLILATAGRPDDDLRSCALANLRRYAEEAASARGLAKPAFDRSRMKTGRVLGPFDCIAAPCTELCGVDQKVPQYMRLVRQGRYGDAAEITRLDNPLPSILGRACDHLCEGPCVRGHYDEPLAIREIKRFIMDRERRPRVATGSVVEGGRTAVVGAGPCGLAVAYFLCQAGRAVTLFEQRCGAGGMVSGSIPGYRASPEVVDRDLRLIQSLGAEVHFRQRVGEDLSLDDLRRRGFEAIVLAAGAQLGVRLGLENEDAEGVQDGLDMLRLARQGLAPRMVGRVGVIGGGDVAMDCARTAARLTDGEVSIIYRRTLDQMPARAEELEELLEEGITVRELLAPRRLEVEDGRLRGLWCARMELGEPDASGRRRPVELPGQEELLELDHMIVAIGQRPDLGLLEGEDVALSSRGYLEVDPETMETSVPNLYAGGDLAGEGPASIVAACGDGRRIAETILRRGGEGRIRGDEPARRERGEPDVAGLLGRRSRRVRRVVVPSLPADERTGFAEVISTLSETAARQEASRCLDCDLMCSTCVTVCPNRALFTYRTAPWAIDVPVLRAVGSGFETAGSGRFEVSQSLQVAALNDLCNECGNCATFCPTAGAPFRDKPRLFLRRDDFEGESDNAFLLLAGELGPAIRGRFNGSECGIELVSDRIHFASPRITAVLDADTFALVRAERGPAVVEGEIVDLAPAAILDALLLAALESMPELPVGG